VLAVDADDDETRETVAAFAAKLKLTHPIALQGGQASELYDIDGVMPTAFWIDHQGRVVRRETGFQPEMEKEMERMIEDLLRRRDGEAAGASGKEER
jgi:hypothetical protein